MFASLRRFFRFFFSRSRSINNEPLNKVSLLVIILVDIFILTNVFMGINDISQWSLGPSQVYPCYAEWTDYRNQPSTAPADKDFDVVRQAADPNNIDWRSEYQRAEVDHLGKVNDLCLQYATHKDQVKQANNQPLLKALNDKQAEINSLENTNNTIRQQYDSTLLEEIAGQPRDQSINQVGAAQARQNIDQNNVRISRIKADITALQAELKAQPASAAFLTFLKQDATFQQVKKGYERASFWYPSIQLVWQAIFLIPLIIIALAVHTVAQRRNYGLIALISWHLLVIFCIPLILKVFEFLQVGVLFNVLFDIIKTLFGSLLFLVSYLYILLIPLLGFGLIKFFQAFVFNTKLQASSRVQNSKCLKCAKKLHAQDSHCPHCGYYQYIDCEHCHQLTYKHLPYCKHCGTTQDLSAML